MPVSEQSLLDYLRIKNPKLDASATRPGQNTSSKVNRFDEPKRIAEWNDFEYDVLQSIYGGSLRRTLEHSFELNVPTVPRFPFRRLCDEDSFESLVVIWNQSVVSNALSAAQGHLRIRKAQKIYMGKGSLATWPGETNVRRRPDWAAVNDASRNARSKSESRNLLPGETKLSKKWSSLAINQGDIEEADMKENWYQPLAQIFTYCVRNNARYGYIITDKELVVFRVGPIHHSDETDWRLSYDKRAEYSDMELGTKGSKWKKVESVEPNVRAMDSGFMEYKVIPWARPAKSSQSGSMKMTVNLALWWLHMLAMNENAIEAKYTALKDSEWNMLADVETQTQSSSFTESQDDSQEKQASRERCSRQKMKRLSLNSKRPSGKRSRSDDQEEYAALDENESPQKRRLRGRV